MTTLSKLVLSTVFVIVSVYWCATYWSVSSLTMSCCPQIDNIGSIMPLLECVWKLVQQGRLEAHYSDISTGQRRTIYLYSYVSLVSWGHTVFS